MSRRRKRELDAEERRIWEVVTRSVAPLPTKRPARLLDRQGGSEPPGKLPDPPAPAMANPMALAPPAAVARLMPRSTAAPATPAMSRKERRAVVRGKASIDARLDLHGLRQEEARRQLQAFISRSAAAGHRTVLIVTGKGSDGLEHGHFLHGERSPRGVLRRLTPMLLESPAMRDLVLGYETADQRHGGAGALYVRLKRKG